MTSAPKSDSTVAAAGAAMKLAQSITFSPANSPSAIVVLSTPVHQPGIIPGASEAREPGSDSQAGLWIRGPALGPSPHDA